MNRIVDAVAPLPEDTILEIGPGRGALTAALAGRAARVIAVEIDRDLARTLSRLVPSNVHVVCADVLKVDLPALIRGVDGPVRVVGNLPYNVASPILFRLLEESHHGRTLSDATVMLQREVGNRLVAGPGTPDYGALTAQVNLRAAVAPLLHLPPGAFRPPPKVRSAVVRLTFHAPAVDVGDEATFERVVRGIFRQRRKMMANALEPVVETLGRSARSVLSHARIDPRRRPGTLSLTELARLSRAML